MNCLVENLCLEVFSCDSVMNFAPTKADEGTILGGDSMVFVSNAQISCLLLWAPGLGNGFWLRGVQPRTAMQ